MAVKDVHDCESHLGGPTDKNDSVFSIHEFLQDVSLPNNEVLDILDFAWDLATECDVQLSAERPKLLHLVSVYPFVLSPAPKEQDRLVGSYSFPHSQFGNECSERSDTRPDGNHDDWLTR